MLRSSEMATKIDTIPPRHFVRRCMACGYDGPGIHAGQSTHCALCGCDLSARPPRSYAELEGFVELWPEEPPREVGLDPARAKILQRWVAFLFFAICTVGMLAYLTMAVLAI
jgi:hypothetical protein